MKGAMTITDRQHRMLDVTAECRPTVPFRLIVAVLVAAVLAPSTAGACDAATYIRIMKEHERARAERPATLLADDVFVLHAEGLTGALERAAAVFVREHPGHRVFLESCSATGLSTASTTPADVIALTDAWPIRELLMPSQVDWYVAFARDELVIAYGGEGRHYDELRDAAWRDIIASLTLRFGRTSPELDDGGVRTELALQLLERHIDRPELADDLRRRSAGLGLFPTTNALVGALLNDTADYALLYRSVATYHRMLMTELPPEVDLGDRSLGDVYATATVKVPVPGRTEVLERHGAPIVCAFTIPRTAVHRPAARRFAEFLLSQRGAAAVTQSGLVPIPGGQVAFSKETSIR